MKSEYQKIISKTLKSYRKEKGFSLEKLAELCDSSPSSLSKIENNKYYGHYDTLIYIFDKLGISFIIDPELIEYYDSLFDDLFLNIVMIDDSETKYHNEIEKNKDNILNSVCKYRYCLYDFVYAVRNSKIIDDITIRSLIKDESHLSEIDKQILYCYLGIYHSSHEIYEKATEYFIKALNFPIKELGYAMAATFYIEILAANKKYVEAVNYINEAISIFKKYDIPNRSTTCYLVLGNIYSQFNEVDKALEKYKYIIEYVQNLNTNNKTLIRNADMAFHNILWCHVKRSNDKKRTYRYIQSLDNENDLKRFTYSTFELVLEFFFKIKDKDNFDKWYDYFIKCNDNRYEKTYRLSKLLKDILDKGYSDDNLDKAFKLLDDLDIPYDEDEYVLVNDILIDYYKSIKDTKRADELYRKMMKIKQ